MDAPLRAQPLRRLAALSLLAAGLATGAQAAPLWELTGTSNRIVLLGSVHLLRGGDDGLDPLIAEALDEAEVLVMELALDGLDPVESAATLVRLAVDPDGRTLDELLGAKAWTESLALADEVEIDLRQLAGFEPWYAAVMVTQLRLAQLGFDPALGVESRLTGEARSAGKEIRGLETLEDQLRTLDSLSAEAQRQFFLTTIGEAATVEDQIDDVVAAWRTGNTAALEKNLLEDIASQPEVYRNVVVDRNRHFATEIAGLANDRRDYLVVVGVLHLVGRDSVLAMLREAGHGTRQLGDRGNRQDDRP